MNLYIKTSLTQCVLLLVTTIISCSTKIKNEEKGNVQKTNLDTRINSDSATYDFYGELGKILKFDLYKADTNYTEIRIWNISTDTGKVIQIQNEYNKWNSRIYHFKMNIDTNYKINSIKKMIYTSYPYNGWESFVSRMESYGVYNFKNYSEISNYNLTMGGGHLFLEIIKDGNYKKCLYLGFEANEKTVSDVQRLLQIIFLICNSPLLPTGLN